MALLALWKRIRNSRKKLVDILHGTKVLLSCGWETEGSNSSPVRHTWESGQNEEESKHGLISCCQLGVVQPTLGIRGKHMEAICPLVSTNQGWREGI
jgi:hypothetical protein